MSGGGYGQSPMGGQQMRPYGQSPMYGGGASNPNYGTAKYNGPEIGQVQHYGGGSQGGMGVGNPQGGYIGHTGGPSFGGNPQMSNEFRGGNLGNGMPNPYAQQPPQAPQASWGPQGFNGMEFSGGRFSQQAGGVNDANTGETYGTPTYKRYGQPPRWQNPLGQPAQPPQMSNEVGFQAKGGLQQAPQQAPMSAIGPMVNQRASAPSPQQFTGQSYDQFAQTLANSGMTSGQMADLYAKQSAPQTNQSAPTNFWANTGTGTQKPPGFNPPPAWGNQTYGFDPKSLAGKTVGQDMAWYYGQDSVGRPINNQGDAYAQFGSPADGYQRTAPWQR